jgi:5'-3' exonuclease
MSDLMFNSSYPIVLIDNSYYVFYRFFATMSWFRKQNTDINHVDIISNKEFMIAFFKHFDADIKKIVKKFKTIHDNIIFCIDCPRSTIWRNEIYDKYKQSRIKKDNFNSNIFNIFEEYLSNNNFKNCKYDNLEADDIVYLLQYRLTIINHPNNIYIITNDSDYLQMYSNTVKIYNMQFLDLSLKIKYNPNVELIYKIIIGDKSDNIAKIQNGLKKNIALKLALMNDDERYSYLEKNNMIAAYNLNKNLIDFREIPKIIVENFYEFYNISIIYGCP